MQFEYHRMPHWPPLAWIAECRASNGIVQVFHGNDVETRNHWFCEAVWAGNFQEGDFDETDIIAGSGGRIRENNLCFVSSGSNVDRLQHFKKNGSTFVSNSLICLLEWIDSSPNLDYLGYSRDFSNYQYTIFGNHTIPFPTSAGQIEITYFANLLWNGDFLAEQVKPFGDRKFVNFNDYQKFLEKSMQSLTINAGHKNRTHPFKMVCPLSNGYDSPTVAALAHDAGDIVAFTFNRDRDGADDSGEPIANALGIPCEILDRDSWRSVRFAEVPFIACSGSVGDLAFKSAEHILKHSVLLSGPSGDLMWAKHTNVVPGMAVGDGSMLGLTEYRLWSGFINCAIPYWGVRQIDDIVRLSNSDELKTWSVERYYDRPICRRIVEGAGVPHHIFGVSKKGMSVVPPTANEFLSPISLENLLSWLNEQRKLPNNSHISLPNPFFARILDRFVSFVNAAFLGTCITILDKYQYYRHFRWLAPIVYSLKRIKRPYYHLHYSVHWAIDCAKKRYRANSHGKE